jgi:endoglucanase
VAAAKEHDIPFQARAMPRGTGTDANAMQLSRGGVATAIIGIPNRYMHTPAELVSLKDVQWASQLIAEWVATLTPETSFIP